MRTAAEQTLSGSGVPLLRVGRTFVGPTFDLMLIGGGLSLLTIGVLTAAGYVGRGSVPTELMLTVVFLFNSTHFAASTVRLYSKPGSFQDLPALTMLFPLISVAILTVGLIFADVIGGAIYKLYLTWSPYHYAAQTYGLAAMYAVRSGCKLSASSRSLLWWTCMLPFAYAFVQSSNGGLGWFLSPSFLIEHPAIAELRWQLVGVFRWVVLGAPVLLFARVHQQSRVGLPLISILLMFTNGIWWAALDYLGAILWATVFHGVQYLAIVIIFHLRDHPPKRPGPTSWVGRSLQFYGLSAVLAYLLFEVWPYFYVLVGFSFAESALMCVAVINLHHFVVDRGIWQIRKDPRNRSTVVE